MVGEIARNGKSKYFEAREARILANRNCKKKIGVREARTLDLTHNFSYETYALANFPSMLMYWFGVNLNWNIKEFH
jgi:hypothetical protein